MQQKRSTYKERENCPERNSNRKITKGPRAGGSWGEEQAHVSYVNTSGLRGADVGGDVCFGQSICGLLGLGGNSSLFREPPLPSIRVAWLSVESEDSGDGHCLGDLLSMGFSKDDFADDYVCSNCFVPERECLICTCR